MRANEARITIGSLFRPNTGRALVYLNDVPIGCVRRSLEWDRALEVHVPRYRGSGLRFDRTAPARETRLDACFDVVKEYIFLTMSSVNPFDVEHLLVCATSEPKWVHGMQD